VSGGFVTRPHEDALHGWTVPGRTEIFAHEQAVRAFWKVAALFEATPM
jgi:hypothetical protein